MMRDHSTSEDSFEEVCLYALGAFDQAEARQFENHLSDGCESCREGLSTLAPVIAALGASLPPVAPSPRVREKLKAFLREESQKPQTQLRQEASPLAPGVTIRASEGNWREVFEGVFIKPLFTDRERGTDTFLMRLLPGARVPDHKHHGAEQCLVLEGEVESNDLKLHAGDYHCAPPGSAHESLRTVNGALLLLVAPRNPAAYMPR